MSRKRHPNQKSTWETYQGRSSTTPRQALTSTRKDDLEALQRMQESRPKKPPGVRQR